MYWVIPGTSSDCTNVPFGANSSIYTGTVPEVVIGSSVPTRPRRDTSSDVEAKALPTGPPKDAATAPPMVATMIPQMTRISCADVRQARFGIFLERMQVLHYIRESGIITARQIYSEVDAKLGSGTLRRRT